MFRKIANLFVLLLFVVSTTGFTISKHYCHGDLVSIALNTEPTSCCDMSSCGCCHNENQFYQLEDDYTASQNFIIKSQIHSVVVYSTIHIEELEDQITKDIRKFDYGSPFIDRQFLYYTHQLKLAPPIC